MHGLVEPSRELRQVVGAADLDKQMIQRCNGSDTIPHFAGASSSSQRGDRDAKYETRVEHGQRADHSFEAVLYVHRVEDELILQVNFAYAGQNYVC